MLKRLTSFLLCVCMVLSMVPAVNADTQAAEQAVQVMEGEIQQASADDYCTDLTDAGSWMQHYLRILKDSFTIKYCLEGDFVPMAEAIFEAGMQHNGNAILGDYLRLCVKKYSAQTSYYFQNGYCYMTIDYTVTYRVNDQKETTINSHLYAIGLELELENLTGYDSMVAIYDWITRNVAYDYDNVNNPDYDDMLTPYGALVDGKAVCQGYAMLLYRMLLEEDIDCRIVTGIGNGGAHAWVIAKMGDKYYNLDPTWDAARVQAGLEYQYYLCSDENFPDHVRDEAYTTEEFTAAYPVGAENYTPPDRPTSGVCGDALTWKLGMDGTLTISGTGEMYDYYLEAPWRASANTITAIVVEEGVTSIGYSAFLKCYRAFRVSLPSSLTTIGETAFYGCDALTEITIPENVTSMGEGAFAYCSSLASVEILGKLTVLPRKAFENCQILVSVTLPEGLVTLDKNCFAFCDALESIVLPSTVERIEYYAFVNTNLRSITIPAGVTYIGEEAFSGCLLMKEIVFLGTAPTIHSIAFQSVTANCYYPVSDSSWDSAKGNYGGTLSWSAADVGVFCVGGHTYGEWYISQIPLCVLSGTKRQDCENCASYQTGYAAPYGHIYYSTTTEPGEDTAGYIRHQCMECDYNYIEFTDPSNNTRSDAILLLRDAVIHRRKSITVAYWDTVQGSEAEALQLWEAAIGHSDIPYLGDYVMGEPEYFFGASGWVQKTDGDRYLNYADFDLSYSSDFDNEQKMDSALSVTIKELALDGKSDFEKIRIIHDYVCTLITYGSNGLKSHTASGAFLNGYGVCQGYALLTYRLMLEAGIDCRYISGTSRNMGHGWNIVKLDGVYYNLDTTWDDGANNVPIYTYFLRCQENFPDHIRDAEFDTPEFHEQYPMANKDYVVTLGSCGEDAHWALYPDGSLVLSGSGKVKRSLDWDDYDDQITRIVIEDGITELDSNVFFNLENVKSIVFAGDAPAFGNFGYFLPDEKISAYYPAGNATWTEDKLGDQGGCLQWLAYLAQGKCDTDLSWVLLADGTLTISGTGKLLPKNGYYPWTYTHAGDIKKVIIGEGITGIGEYAFNQCPILTEVSLPDTLETIDRYAFYFCLELTAVTIPRSVTAIGENAFSCTGLTEVTIPGSVTLMGSGAFQSCDQLSKVIFKGDVPQIADDAFYYCQATGWYPIGNPTWTDQVLDKHYGGIREWVGVTAFAVSALEGGTGTPGETLTWQVTAEGEDLTYAWYLRLANDDSFTQVGTDKASLELVLSLDMNNAELYCAVTNTEGDTVHTNTVTLNVYGKLVQDVPQTVLLGDRETKTFLFTPTVSCFYRFAVTDCEAAFAELYDENGNLIAESDGGGNYEAYVTCQLEAGKTYQLKVRFRFYGVAGNVTVNTTRCHGNLTTNTLTPATCSSSGLVEHTCGACGESWQEKTFTGHSYENGSCVYCGKAAAIVGGSCGEKLFWELNSDGSFEISGEGEMYDYDMYTLPWASYADSILSVTVREGATSLGEYSFYQCAKIIRVTLPGSLEKLGESAFLGCKALKEITIPEKVTVIPGWAFFQCNALEKVTIQGQVTEIGESAFYYCQALPEITLPQSLKTIGENAFFFCSLLTTITIPASVTAIEDYAFYSCQGLQEIIFLGDAPTMQASSFYNLTSFPKAYYPDLPSWTEAVREPHVFLDWVVHAHTHSYNSTVVAPDCTQQGYTEYVCACGDSYREGFVSSLGHSFTQYVSDGNATCTIDGTKTAKCDRCAVTDTKTDVGSARGHSYVNGVCSLCGQESGVSDPIPGDIDGNGVVETDDVVQLLLHISMPDLFPIQADADFDGNGAVETDDAIKLLLHISMPDMFPI